MRKSRFTEEQIAMALRQGEAGTPVEEICRKMGVSEGRKTPKRPGGTSAAGSSAVRPGVWRDGGYGPQ